MAKEFNYKIASRKAQRTQTIKRRIGAEQRKAQRTAQPQFTYTAFIFPNGYANDDANELHVLKVTNIQSLEIAETTAQTFLNTGAYERVAIYVKDNDGNMVDYLERLHA